MTPRTKPAKAARAVDRGATGPAMANRPTRMVDTLEDGVRAQPTMMDDADRLNGMGLSRLQVDVAAYLRGLWRDCLPGLDLPGAMGDCGLRSGRKHLTADEEAATARAWLDYRRAMDYLRHNAGYAAEAAVKAAVIDGQPARVAAVKAGLDMLAHHWRMK